MSEPPEIVYQLLREAWKLGHNVSIRENVNGRWCARVGNSIIVTPEVRPGRGREPEGWLLEQYPPPRKPISTEPWEVGP